MWVMIDSSIEAMISVNFMTDAKLMSIVIIRSHAFSQEFFF